MKKYIILSSITGIGGWQTYTNNKVAGVRQFGWIPYAIGLHSPSETDSMLENLKPFRNYSIFELNFYPAQISKNHIASIISSLSDYCDYKPDDEVVVEATTEELLLWAEVFAEAFHGKAICVNVKNQFPNHSDSFINYLAKKKERGELLFVNNDALASLFKSHFKFEVSSDYVVSPLTFNCLEANEVDYKDKLQLKKYDYVIGAIGWMDKEYYPALCEQVSLLAEEHPDKRFVFVSIGSSSKGDIEKRFENRFAKIENLTLILLGSISPIPLNLVACFDVCVASFGSAVLSDKAGVKTIMMYDHDDIPLGIMGYTLTEWPYHINRTNYDKSIKDLLKAVLFDKICDSLEYKPTDYGVNKDEEIKKHIEYLNSSSVLKEYYSVRSINEASWKFRIGAFLGACFGFRFCEWLINLKNRLSK